MTKSPPARRPAVSMKMSDIAQLAGVSESTISRALSGSKLINDATRERIQRIADEHGYKIDLRARNLRLQKTGTISVVFPLLHEAGQGISDPFFLEMLGYLADELSGRGYDLLLHKIGPQEPRGLSELLQEKRTDGVLLIGQSTQHALLNELAEEYRPLVVWGAGIAGSHYVTVGSDNYGGGLQAVAHLIALGHRRIAFLGEWSLPEIAARYAGYRAALTQAGIEIDPELEFRVPFEGQGAKHAISSFLDRGQVFDAVFAASDVMAIAAIRVFDQRGIRVPADVAVVGFDDIMLAGLYTPALTTVKQDIAGGARQLVASLFQRMGGEEPESTLLPTTLVIRGSCGA